MYNCQRAYNSLFLRRTPMTTHIVRNGSYWGLVFNVGDKIDAAGRYTYVGEDAPSKKMYRRVLVVDAADGKTKSRTLQGIISQSHKSSSTDKSWDRKKRNAKLFQPGDTVGPNGVIFVSYYDDDGNVIPPTASGGRCGLFECVCGNRFISSFANVMGYANSNGTICPSCVAKRKSRLIAEKRREAGRDFSKGDIMDPNGMFEFIEELEPHGKSRMVRVRETDSGMTSIHTMRRICEGMVLTKLQKENKIRNRSRDTFDIGTVIENDKDAFTIVRNVSRPDSDNAFRSDRIVVRRSSDNREFTTTINRIMHNNVSGDRLVDKVDGDVVNKAGVEFVSWCDEQGNEIPDYVTRTGANKKQALFRCSCENRTLFVAPYDYVSRLNRTCPQCMENNSNVGMDKKAQRVKRIVGQPIDPDARFIYMGSDDTATTKNEKCIVKDIVTGEVFSALFKNLRNGTAKPPSECVQNMKRGHNNNRQYGIGDVIGKNNNLKIIAELEPLTYTRKNGKSSIVRRVVCQNLDTGMLFDAPLQDILNGKITGARAKKTFDDYPGVNLAKA